MTKVFPKEFKYDPMTRQLTVEFVNGLIMRFFDVNSQLSFLDEFSPRRNADFLAFANAGNNKREVIQQPTVILPEPQTRPAWIKA